MNNVKIFVSVVVILVLGVVVTVIVRSGSTTTANLPGKYDGFAQCIKDSGTVFYGAFWCPHCKAQKEQFGSSVKFLPYVECSTLDAKGQTQNCMDKKISSYPTWEFPDGTRLTGEIPLSQLSEKTSCELPI
jgi:thiol-disulfide isomerase/thioredoxin